MYHTIYTSPIGPLRLVSDEGGLRQLWLPNEIEEKICPQDWKEDADFSINRLIAARLDDYFAGRRVVFDDLPLAPHGTPFQQAVWQRLLTIPYGEISHYSIIAQQMDKPKAVRAVGGAVGRNPISILIPCHRVLGRDMSLTGYSGGLPIKRALLALEKIAYRP